MPRSRHPATVPARGPRRPHRSQPGGPLARWVVALLLLAGVAAASASTPATSTPDRHPSVETTIRSSSSGGVVEPQPQELTWENIFRRDHGATDAALSPDGRWVAVTATSSARRGIWLVATDGTSEPVFWVEGRRGTWTPDGVSLVYLHDDDLWIADRPSPGAEAPIPRRLTDDADDERAPRVSPRGDRVAFYSSRSGYQDIWTVPLDPPSDDGPPPAPDRLTEEAMSVDDPRFAPAWSPDGRRIAYVSNRADYWEDDVWVVDVESGDARQLSTELMASSTPTWSPDGKRVALLGTAKDEYWYEDLAYIYLVDAETGEETVVDMQVWATDWLHNHGVHWSADGRRLFFLYHQRGDLNLWAVPSGGGVATRVTHGGGAVRAFDATPGGDAFVLVRSVPTRGYDVDLVTDRGGRLRRLTRFSPEWSSLQEPEEISYRSFDGLYIQGFLYTPPGTAEPAGAADEPASPSVPSGHREPSSGTTVSPEDDPPAGGSTVPEGDLPALVHVHGGGTNSYLRSQNLVEQYLASRGYLVYAVNYRGGSGFGRRFQDLSVNDWANGQARDAAAAADFLRGLPRSNGRVGIYGYSYGGITTMAAIARVPDAFDAAVPMAGIYDFADAYETADRLGRIFIKTGHGGSPEERPETYAVSDTLARLDAVETPLLIMHGEEDVRAPYRQFELAVEALREHGVEFEAKSYPGEPHGFRDPAHRVDMYRRLEEFFARELTR